MEVLDVKRMLYVLLSAVFAIALTACGSGNEEDAADAEEQETNQEEKPQTDSSNAEFDALVSAMEEETEDTATLLFENNESQSHEMEGLTLTLDAYQLVELEDFHTNFSIPFEDQTDGGVILAQYTVKNDSDQDLHYMPTLDIDYVGATKYYSNYRDLIPLEEQLPTILSPDNEYLVEAGDEVTGYYAYPFGQKQLDDILAEGNVIVDVPAPTTEYNEYSSTIGSGTEFTLPLDDDSAEKSAETESQGFYQDRISAENMGDKEMIEQ